MNRVLALVCTLLMSTVAGCGDDDTDGDTGVIDSGTDVGDSSTEDAGTDTNPEDTGTEDTGTGPGRSPNIVLLIADDLGVDEFVPYQDESDGRGYAPVPNLAGLCDRGVRYTRAWATPTCSPTRATLLTGRYGFRTGIGAPVGGRGLSSDEPTLPRLVDEQELGYNTANIGKWHLGSAANLAIPLDFGWDHFSGFLSGSVPSYFEYDEVVDGETQPVSGYATSEMVDDAITWLSPRTDEPFFLWLAFNAPHTPYHVPPAELHTREGLVDDADMIRDNPRPYFQAMVEALDTEVGRLLEYLDENVDRDTVVIFIGDNGTPSNVAQRPWGRSRSKGTIFDGGIHVPLCVAGPGISARTEDGLVNSVDLSATILELMDGEAPTTHPYDGMSLLNNLRSETPIEREFLLSELFGAAGGGDARAIRGERYKLIRLEDGERFHDLDDDPQERTNLLDASGAPPATLQDEYDALSAALDALAE